jgi:hypothetical protein
MATVDAVVRAPRSFAPEMVGWLPARPFPLPTQVLGVEMVG